MSFRHAQYVPGMDLLRFLAAAIVMLFHLGFWSWAYPQGQVARASQGVADFYGWANFTASGWAGVQIFFVISGFVIAISAQHASSFRFFASRFVRLVPGALICATVTLCAWLAIDVGYTLHHLIAFVRSVLFHPLPPWIDSVYWTLGVEVAFYSLVLALIWIKRFHWIKSTMIAVGSISTVFWIGFTVARGYEPAFELFKAVQWSRLSQLLLVQHGVFFALGVLMWLQWMRRATRVQSLWLALFTIGGCLQIAGEAHLKLEKTGIAVSPAIPCAIWLGSLLFCYVAVRHNDRIHALPPKLLQFLRRLGLMTYPLYLLHNVAGGALMGALAQAGLSTASALAWAVIGILALSAWVSSTPEPYLQGAARRLLYALHERWCAIRQDAQVTRG